MNLFQIGTTKDGRMVVTFSKSPEAKQVLKPLVSELFALAGGGCFLEKSSTEPPSSPIRERKRLCPQTAEAEKQKQATQFIQYEQHRKMLTPEQRVQDDQLLEIGLRVSEYCEFRYGSGDKKTISTVYTQLYKMFQVECGYYPSWKVALPYLKCYTPNRKNTLVKEGKGKEFISFINRLIRQLNAQRVG